MSDYLTVQEAAELARCEHKTIRRAIHAGLLPASKPAGRLLIRADHARAWIEGRSAARPLVRSAEPRQTRHTAQLTNITVARLRDMDRKAMA